MSSVALATYRSNGNPAARPDRSVQFTDWDTGDRVIVNFGDHLLALPDGDSVPARSFVTRKAKP